MSLIKLMFLLMFSRFISYSKGSSFSKQLSFYFISFTLLSFTQDSGAYLESRRTPAMEFFAKIVKGFYKLTIFAKMLIPGCSTGL